MRAVVQRVKSSSVEIEGKIVGEVAQGFNILLGVGLEDDINDALYLADKIVNLRVFEDSDEKMNLSLLDVKGDVLIISQFTLYGDCRKGRRPNFMASAKQDKAESLYEDFVKLMKKKILKVETGEFGADMNVKIENDGPVTILLDSKKIF